MLYLHIISQLIIINICCTKTEKSMKRIFTIALIMLFASMVASAQWKVESVTSGEANTKLLQILETEKSVLVYGTFEKECTERTFTKMRRATHVKVNGLKYKLLHSVNLPIFDEGDQRWAVLDAGHNEINFVMEFEKFPVEGGFDIVGTTEHEEDYDCTFRGVTVSRIDTTQIINTERFLDGGTPVIYGVKANDGTSYVYYIREGVCITCNAEIVSTGWSSKNEIFYIDIVNNSDHGIMFDFSKVSVVGKKNKSKGQVEEKVWKKYTPESYDQYLRQLDYDEARRNTSSVLDEVGRQIDREKSHVGVNSWGRIGWDALGALTEHSAENRIEEYMKEHPKYHPTALKAQSIKSGESIYGYVAVEWKKSNKATITIPMDGYDFRFTFNH